MPTGSAFFLAITFLMSLAALWVFIYALMKGQFLVSQKQARVIFDPGELGQVEDPAHSRQKPETNPFEKSSVELDDYAKERRELDLSGRRSVLIFFSSSIFWLVLASVFGLLVSLKFHWPEFLSDNQYLTFGRLRPLHLTMVTYGWMSMAGMGACLWLIPRLTRKALVGEKYCFIGSIVWNIGVLLGSICLFFGISEGVEWLEYPWYVDLIIATAGGLAAIPAIKTVIARTESHIYVSLWYILGGFLWFPMLFVVANIPGVHFGVEHAIANWWFAHNVLGLWLTPLGLAIAYYLIPKVIGRPIFSYQLSLVGFWGLAFFYAQVGMHHLIGGPIPTWLANLSIVMSVGMVVPVVAVAINHHVTMVGHFKKLVYSPTLRFVVFGAMMYTLSSLQGCLHALRTFNTVSHFTHWTVSHAHLGAYGFTTMVLFAAIYFILPRVLEKEWPFPEMISLHFWGAFVGIIIYVISTGVGGWLQGLELTDPSSTFQNSVLVTIPYLVARSLGGTLMVGAHIIFLVHVVCMFLGSRKSGDGPAFLNRPDLKERAADHV